MRRKISKEIAAAFAAKKAEVSDENAGKSLRQQKRSIGRKLRNDYDFQELDQPKKTTWSYKPNMLVRSKKIRGKCPVGADRIFLVVCVQGDYLQVLVEQSIEAHHSRYFFPID